MKKIIAFCLVTCMALSLCACGEAGNGNTEKPGSETESQQAGTENGQNTEKESEADGKVQYTIKVVDENGTPIANALVQMCLDSCMPGSTNADGVATFKLVAGAYKVSFLSLPAGYTYSTDATEFYFDGDATDMTITLKAE